jgi:hypothetical protein
LCFCIRYGFQKKCDGAHYTELVLLHPVGSTSHVVIIVLRPGAKCRCTIFLAQAVPVQIAQKVHWDTLCQTSFFASSCICGSRSAFRCIWGTKCQRTIFHARVGRVRISQKAQRDTLRRTCVFTSAGICGSRSALRCVRGAKHQHTIFHARVGPVRIPEKMRQDTLRRTCFPIRWDQRVT